MLFTSLSYKNDVFFGSYRITSYLMKTVAQRAMVLISPDRVDERTFFHRPLLDSSISIWLSFFEQSIINSPVRDFSGWLGLTHSAISHPACVEDRELRAEFRYRAAK